MKNTIIVTSRDGKTVVYRRGKFYRVNKKAIILFTSAAALLTSSSILLFNAKKNSNDEDDIKNSEQFEITTSDDSEENVDSILDSLLDGDRIGIHNNDDGSSIDDSNKDDIEFNQLRTLQELFNVNYEELKNFIGEYASYSNYSYEEALNIVYEQRDVIFENYSNPETGIVYSLFDYAENEGRVSYHCTDRSQIQNKFSTFPNSYYDFDEMNAKLEQCSEIEEELLKICDDIGIEGEERYLALSIFRIETGYGASEMCVYDNNYGGIKFDGVYAIFSNPEYGMFKTLNVMKRYFLEAHDLGYYDIQSITSYMSPTYCAVDIDRWSSDVYSMYLDVSSEYSSNTKKFVR